MNANGAGRLAAVPLMTAVDGRVHLASMPANDQAMAERIMALVDDALRAIAAAGDLPGRVVVVRPLDVATLPQQPASPARIAELVRAEVAQAVSTAVRGDDPKAAAAPMVYFKDEPHVVEVLTQRVATNQPSTEWFWPSVVKGWTPSAPPERTIPLLMERALSTPAPVVTLAHVVQTLASTGVLDTVLERLSEADGRAWLKMIEWPERPAAREPIVGQGPRRVLPMPTERYVARWVERWGGGARDPRAVWLGAMLLVADRPERADDPRLPREVREWLASVAARVQGGSGEELDDGAMGGVRQREGLMADARAWLRSNPRSPLDSLFGGGPPLALDSRATTAKTAANRVRDESSRDPSLDPPTWRAPRPTDHAGFPLLIPLLTQVGLQQILTHDPSLLDRDWPTALLLRLARRLGIPFDDPAVAWLATPPASIAHDDRALTAEVLRAARIRLRMNGRIPLRHLVRRPGAIVAGSDQIDVLLQPADVDAAVRRAGLDARPALVPWIGRAVYFRYLDAVDLSA